MSIVLCVDDDAPALATVARALRDVSPVVTAASASEARAKLGSEVAVVLSDYRMPDVAGTALLAEVRAHDETIGRILLTAYADVEVLMDAINRGHVHRYVAKPWDPRELRAAVRHALAHATAERERRRLTAEIAQAYARLRELDAMKSRFLTLAAHELRTPVHVVGVALEALESADLSAHDTRDLLASARRNLEWLARSVRAMTELARLGRAVRPTGGRECVAAIARRVLGELGPVCERRRLAVSCELPAAAPVVGVAADLHRALVNLVLNAIRFTPDGGTIEIAVGCRPGTVEVTVSDTGIGIPVEVRDRIGEPFFTVAEVDHHHSDAVAFQSGGMGLGLAVAHAIAREHGGRIWFESEVGRGSRFHLEIPAPSEITSPERDRTDRPCGDDE